MKIEWALLSGKMVVVNVSDYLDRATLSVRNDGKLELGSAVVKLSVPKKVGSVIIVASIGRIGLTQVRYDAVIDAVARLQAEIDGRPEVQMRKLSKQRSRLAREVCYILDAQQGESQAAVESMSRNGFARRSKRNFGAEADAARNALNAFDLVNPAVLEEINKSKADDTARFLATN